MLNVVNFARRLAQVFFMTTAMVTFHTPEIHPGLRRGVAGHDTQQGENNQTILYTFLLFLAVVGGSVG